MDILWITALGGAAGAAVAYGFLWRISRSLYDLDYRLAALEDKLLVEMKKRASNVRWSKDEELLTKLSQLAAPAVKSRSPVGRRLDILRRIRSQGGVQSDSNSNAS